ncbi:cation diffusion facilitator family transporter [Thiobacter aerophilum]|uniref:Cation diffusion facilitator family transporter n=1 Tax=Thiobacter aerophilum TaxID=3121275 RepID=A0ABV0EI01_9BURK
MSPASFTDSRNITPEERYRATQRVTWVSVAANLLLTLLQIIVGYLGRSQALVADGLHSASDLLSDFLVLFANRHGSRGADANHPYGHARIETAATLALGAMLMGLGAALLWGAGVRLGNPAAIQPVHVATLYIALITLAGKEALFRYMMVVARRLRSQMLVANAWHSRSDAASSLLVVLGISGNLLGYRFLDLVAALLVAFLIIRMGWKMAFQALSELIDTGLSEEEVAAIRATLEGTPGVRGLHELRTRRMGDQALVDAHVLVDERISVSEGHHIAERARKRVLEHHDVLDVMVHVDPEDDALVKPSAHLPPREALLARLRAALGETLPEPQRVQFHYLDGQVEVEILLPENLCADPARIEALRSRIQTLKTQDPLFRAIRVHADYPQIGA